MKKSNFNIPEGTLIIDYEYYKQLLWQSIEIERLNNIINTIKEELSDDNKFELFYADENINTLMALGAKYYREYLLDKLKELKDDKE